MKFQLSTAIEQIRFFIQSEAYLVLWILVFLSFVFYKTSLKEISLKRHTNLKSRFQSTFKILATSTFLSAVYWMANNKTETIILNRFLDYVAFFALIFLCVAFVKSAQILVYLYLFFKNIRQGIPRLIVNLFTVVLSLIVISYMASEVFSIHVTAVLATSAVFSLVLGLALQDTLGNLFSGVAMQIGQPFKIGDWIEIDSEGKKWTGQIQEITWRATFLTSFSDEWMMIPNKTMAQSQIVILTNNNKTLRHSLLFRIDYHSDLKLAKKLILDSIHAFSDEIMTDPSPRVLSIETTESWITVKVFYSIFDFSLKYRIADKVIDAILDQFYKNNIKLAANRLTLQEK